MKIIESNGSKLAVFIPQKEMQNGLEFYSEDKDFIQVGVWKYDKGKKLRAHTHTIAPREISRTQEMIHVIRGKVKAFIFSEEEKLVKEIMIQTGDILILLSGGHGYEILEDNTCVLEVKNGPYVGADKDRKRIDV